jgi:4-hydroxyacetophenone monooxygenase
MFGVDYPYPYAYCPWTENFKYFAWVADRFEVRDHITFDTEVRSLTWDEEDAMWEIVADGPNGQRVSRANAVITSVGFLNRPRFPAIEGLAAFEGQTCHTARWPQDMDLGGKRVAVIGTGSSGQQISTELSMQVDHLTVFQRTPQWLFPVPGYRSPLPHQAAWLDRNVPFYTSFMRLRAVYRINLFSLYSEIDPDFEDPFAINPAHKRVRDRLVDFLEHKLGDPDLVAKMTPRHVPFSSRSILVDADYSLLDAMQRDNVTLVTEGIRRVNTSGIEAGDGTQHDVDVIVLATGFRAKEYLFPMTIRGRGGRTTSELWADGGPRAYLGCMLPGFPNLWTIYGPNTNGGLNVATFHELITGYALRCMQRMILDGTKATEVTEEAYWRYNRLLDERNAHKAWADPRTQSYYWAPEFGRSVTMCPFRPGEMAGFLEHPVPEDLEVR